MKGWDWTDWLLMALVIGAGIMLGVTWALLGEQGS